MPSKKKKYNARFPAGRIKKIMQTDEEVGKVAQAVPVIISRTLELFVGSLLTKAMQITSAKNAKTLSPSHMKQCILSEQRFDFLKDLVKTVQDSTNGEEETNTATNLLPPGPNMSVSERRKSSCTVLKEEVTNDEELIQEEIKEETKQEIKEEPEWSERVPQQPASANCSTLRLCPNFYTETWPEQRVSIHKPPVVPGYQPAHPSYSPGKPTYQPAQPSYQPAQPLYQVAQPSYPESSSLTPSPILVMDEDYDT